MIKIQLMKIFCKFFLILLIFNSTLTTAQSLEQLSFFEDYEYRPYEDEIVILDGIMYISFKDLSNHITVLQVKNDTLSLFFRTDRICVEDLYLDWKLNENGLIICHRSEIVIEDIFNNSRKIIPLDEPLDFAFNKNYIEIDGPFIKIFDDDQILTIDGNSLEPFPFLTESFLFETDQFYYTIEGNSQILQIDKTTHNKTLVRENIEYWFENYFGINDSLYLINESDNIRFVMQVPLDNKNITITNSHITCDKQNEEIYSVYIHDKVSGAFIDSIYITHENQYIIRILGSDQTEIYYRERKNDASNNGRGAIYNLENQSTKYLTESIQFGLDNLLFFDSIMIFESWRPEVNTYLYNGNRDTLIRFYLESDLTTDDRNFQFWRFDGYIYMRKFEPYYGLQIYKYQANSDDFSPIHQNYLYRNGIGNSLSDFRGNFAPLATPLGNDKVRYIDSIGNVYESPVFNNVVHHVGWMGNDYYYFNSKQDPNTEDTLNLSLIKYDPENSTEKILVDGLDYNQNVAPVNQLKTYLYDSTILTNLEEGDEYFLYDLESETTDYMNKDALDIIQRAKSQSNQVLFAPFKGLKSIDLSNLETSNLLDQKIENIYSNINRTIAIGTDSLWFIEENEIKWRKSLDVNRQSRISFITPNMFIIYGLHSTDEAICYANNGVEKFRLPEGKFTSFNNKIYTKYWDIVKEQYVIEAFDNEGNYINSAQFNTYPTLLTIKDNLLHFLSNDQNVRKFSEDLKLIDESLTDFARTTEFYFSNIYTQFEIQIFIQLL